MPEFQPAPSVRGPSKFAKLPSLPTPQTSYRPLKAQLPGSTHPMKYVTSKRPVSAFCAKTANAPSHRQTMQRIDPRSGQRFADPHANCSTNQQHPTLDLTVQRAIVADEVAATRRKRLEQCQAAAKLSPKEGRHSLLMLVTEAYRWRRDLAQQPRQGLQTSCNASVAPLIPAREVPAILNVHSNPDEYHGVVADIESLMTKPDVVQSCDSKNVYQKILQNLGQLGLFRPEPAGASSSLPLPVPSETQSALPPGLAPDY